MIISILDFIIFAILALTGIIVGFMALAGFVVFLFFAAVVTLIYTAIGYSLAANKFFNRIFRA